MTLGDISTAAIFFKTSHNANFEHYLILTAIVNKYPKVATWVKLMQDHFKDLIGTIKTAF